MNKEVIKEITGFDIHVVTSNGDSKLISFLDFVNANNVQLSIDKSDNEYPHYKLNLHIECNSYGMTCADNTMKKENGIPMNNEEIIRKKVAREILSMIENVCFSEEFRDYRVNKGSNGTRDLIMDNIKNTYDVG